MVAKRWINVGANDIRIPAPDARAAAAPAASVTPYFAWSALNPIAAEYLFPGFDTSLITTANPLLSSIVAPRDLTLCVATLRDVQSSLNGPVTAEVYVDGLATGFAVTMDAGDVLGINDVDTVAVLRGQLVQLRCTANTGVPLLQCAIGML
jgi:hypothetical protein